MSGPYPVYWTVGLAASEHPGAVHPGVVVIPRLLPGGVSS